MSQELFRAAVRAYYQDEKISSDMHRELLDLFADAQLQAMDDGKAIAQYSKYSRDEDLRMFCVNMAVNSRPIHLGDEDKKMGAHELIVRDAQHYYEYVVGGKTPSDEASD